MKKAIYLIVLLVFVNACNTKPHYVLKAKIKGSDSVTFVLQKRDSGRVITIDSAISKKGIFKMTGTLAYPEMVMLKALKTNYRTTFFLENAEIAIEGRIDSLFNAKITGSKTQDEYQSFIDSNKPLRDKYVAYYAQYQTAKRSNNTDQLTILDKEMADLKDQMLALEREFIKNNPGSYFTPEIILNLSAEMKPDEIESIVSSLDTNVAKVPMMQELLLMAKRMKGVGIGQKAPDFTLNDVNDNQVSLYSKVGAKLLLIDMWAAWCSPCRLENPNVVKVYSKFHNKGFDIIGVSLDQKKEDWIKAISDDNLTWTQVSDLKYWNSAIVKLYGITSIPTNFLLDETGNIIARDLRGDDLYNKVKEVLGDK